MCAFLNSCIMDEAPSVWTFKNTVKSRKEYTVASCDATSVQLLTHTPPHTRSESALTKAATFTRQQRNTGEPQRWRHAPIKRAPAGSASRAGIAAHCSQSEDPPPVCQLPVAVLISPWKSKALHLRDVVSITRKASCCCCGPTDR